MDQQATLARCNPVGIWPDNERTAVQVCLVRIAQIGAHFVCCLPKGLCCVRHQPTALMSKVMDRGYLGCQWCGALCLIGLEGQGKVLL